MVSDLVDVMCRESFQTGLWVGLAVALPVATFVLLLRRHQRPVAVGGAAFGLAVVLGAAVADLLTRPVLLVAGLLLLGAGGTLWASRRTRVVVALVLLAPGAFLVSRAAAAEPHFIRPLVFVVTVIGGMAAAAWPRWAAMRPAGPLVLLVTFGGVYTCVPDTEHAVLAVGVALAFAWTGWPLRIVTIDAGGAAVCVGLVAWIAGVDGAARGSSVVGAMACIGVLAVVPVLRGLGDRVELEPGPRGELLSTLGIVAIQLGLVAVCSRVAGFAGSAAVAGVIAVATLGAAAFVAHLFFFSLPRDPAPGKRSQ